MPWIGSVAVCSWHGLLPHTVTLVTLTSGDHQPPLIPTPVNRTAEQGLTDMLWN